MANPFEKKTWQRRLTQYPTRRTLTDTTTGDVQTVDFERAEGQIYQQGDGFTDNNMNDLEDRIYEAFDNIGIEVSHNVPRAIPKDITQYYNDGTLWYRLRGNHGFNLCEDVYVGDYFTLSTGPITCKELSGLQLDTAGANHVVIAHLFIRDDGGIAFILPAKITDGVPQVYHYGRTRIAQSLEEFTNNGCTQFLNEILGTSEDSASSSANATITARLKAEFGNHLGSPDPLYVPSKYDSSFAEITKYIAANADVTMLGTANASGVILTDNLNSYINHNNPGGSPTKKMNILRPFDHYSFFIHGGTVYEPVWLGYPMDSGYYKLTEASGIVDHYINDLFDMTAPSWNCLGVVAGTNIS